MGKGLIDLFDARREREKRADIQNTLKRSCLRLDYDWKKTKGVIKSEDDKRGD